MIEHKLTLITTDNGLFVKLTDMLETIRKFHNMYPTNASRCLLDSLVIAERDFIYAQFDKKNVPNA